MINNKQIKTVFLILVLLMGTMALTQTGKEKTTFIITKTTPYCGGANPPEQILEEAQKKKIPTGETFYIIKGSCNVMGRKIIDSLQMNADGQGFSMLKPGCYSIINDFGYRPVQVDSALFDMECIKKLWEKPLFTFEVKKGKNETFTHNIQENCPQNKPCNKAEIPVPM